MELRTMSKELFEKAIRDAVTVKMVGEYLKECEEMNAKPDLEWLKYLLKSGEQ